MRYLPLILALTACPEPVDPAVSTVPGGQLDLQTIVHTCTENGPTLFQVPSDAVRLQVTRSVRRFENDGPGVNTQTPERDWRVTLGELEVPCSIDGDVTLTISWFDGASVP